jgi:hypothetical protein
LEHVDQLANAQLIPAVQRQEDADAVFICQRLGDIHKFEHKYPAILPNVET